MNNRRNFLKMAGLGLAASGLPGSVNSMAVDSASPYRIKAAPAGPIGGEHVKLKVTPPLFCPYYSLETAAEKGGGACYFKSEAFTHNPFSLKASGMSGSPLIVDAAGRFVAFMTTFAYETSTFNFDGKETLTITVPPGQELYVDESGHGDKAWKAYNAEMMKRLNIKPLTEYPAFWADVEYCTWVEQKFLATKKNEHFDLLTHDFVANYLDKIIALGYPKGKLTLDHGWALFPDGSIDSGFGSWVPDPKKFPNFRKTMDLITNKGFTPGVWIGFPKIQAESLAAKNNPDLLGSWDASATEFPKNEVRYLNPKADLFEYASETIDRFYKMGVRKFKIDMSYNTKSDMLVIHQNLYTAAKHIDKNIEMEFHVPDIFFTKYTDVIRTNDVWLNDGYDWPARVKTHYEVSLQSSPGRMINLDHIGGNETKDLTEAKYLRHLEMFKGKTGYPCISLLPGHISQKCVDQTGDYLWKYQKGTKKVVSDYFNKV